MVLLLPPTDVDSAFGSAFDNQEHGGLLTIILNHYPLENGILIVLCEHKAWSGWRIDKETSVSQLITLSIERERSKSHESIIGCNCNKNFINIHCFRNSIYMRNFHPSSSPASTLAGGSSKQSYETTINSRCQQPKNSVPSCTVESCDSRPVSSLWNVWVVGVSSHPVPCFSRQDGTRRPAFVPSWVLVTS